MYIGMFIAYISNGWKSSSTQASRKGGKKDRSFTFMLDFKFYKVFGYLMSRIRKEMIEKYYDRQIRVTTIK